MSTVSNYLLNSPATNPLCNSFMPVDTDRAEESKVFAENKEDRSPAHATTVVSKTSYAANRVFIVEDTGCGAIRQMVPAGENFGTRADEGSVCMWNRNGLVGEIWMQKTPEFYKWISAIAPCGRGLMTGNRDGGVDVWGSDGSYSTSTMESIVRVSGKYQHSTDKTDRINCLAADVEVGRSQGYYTGHVDGFASRKVNQGQPLEFCRSNKSILGIY